MTSVESITIPNEGARCVVGIRASPEASIRVLGKRKENSGTLVQERSDLPLELADRPMSVKTVIEAKGFEATGSKQTDVIGDVERIIKDKRSDTTFLLFTDGLSWRVRSNDLRKLVKYRWLRNSERISKF